MSGNWGCTVVAVEGSVPQITGDERDRRLAPGSRTNTEEACKPEPGSFTDRVSTLLQMKEVCVSKEVDYGEL